MTKLNKVFLAIALVLAFVATGVAIPLFNFDKSTISTVAPTDETKIETVKEKPVPDFDDSVYVEENWIDKASETYAGGTGTESDPYQISTPEQFAHLAVLNLTNGNAYVKGKYFILTNDIILNDGYFEEDGTYHDGGDGKLNTWKYQAGFTGIFDGQDYAVYGLYNNNLFGNGNINTLVRNLHLRETYISTNYGGSFFNMLSGRMENCSFNGVLSCIDENKNVIGGLVGNCGGKMIGCVNYGKVRGNKAMQVGGITGLGQGGTFINCKNYGEVGCETTKYYVGGIVGVANNVFHCENHGIVRGGNKIGGIVGVGVASYCTNYGKIIGGVETGGIIGLSNEVATSGLTISHNKNFGYVKADGSSGAIVGGIKSANLAYCENYGTMSGGAGIVGVVEKDCIVADCYNEGIVIRGNEGYAGGICNRVYAGGVVKNCENFGLINYAKNTIIGSCQTSFVYNCISMCKNSNTGEKINQIYATDLSKFAVNFKTGKVRLIKNNALAVYMGRVDENVLLSKNFQIL